VTQRRMPVFCVLSADPNHPAARRAIKPQAKWRTAE